MIDRSSEGLRLANDQLTLTNKNLGALDTKLISHMSGLEKHADGLRQLFYQTAEIVGSLPKLGNITEDLNLHDHLAISGSVVQAFQTYARSYAMSAGALQVGKQRNVAYCWMRTLDQHLRAQAAEVERNSVTVSSFVYTSLVLSCCHELAELDPTRRVRLFLVTAMMPDRFFNWPRSSMQHSSPYPGYLASTWAGSKQYFADIAHARSFVKLRRCILVRSGDRWVGNSPPPPFLRSEDDLASMADLMIYERPATYAQIGKLALTNTFPHITHLSRYEDGARFVDIGTSEFYPIGPLVDRRSELISMA